MLDCIAPGPDDIVLPKTSSSVFTSTNVDYILRSLEVKYLVLAGCVTDQCVESAVREACDKHYYVTLVTGTAQLIAAAFMVVCFGRVFCMRALQKLMFESGPKKTYRATSAWPRLQQNFVSFFCRSDRCVGADACATFTQERHDNSLRAIKGFCRQRTLSQLKQELESAT